MLAVSDLFKAAMRESHRVSIAATIYPADGSPAVEAPVISGSLRLDRGARIRRSGTLVCGFDLDADVDFLRTLPFGGYVKLERGVLFADGTIERPQVGYLRVNTISWSQLEGQATFELADRFAQVQDEPFRSPYVPTVTASDAIVECVDAVFEGQIQYHVYTDVASEPVLHDVVYDQDRAQAVEELSSSIGASAYFDALGDFVLMPNPPDASTVEPVWTYDVGDDGNLEEVQENLDRSAVKNGIILKGQTKADAAPFYTTVKDEDPASPTRWQGPFGKVGMVVSLSSFQTKDQARVTGASLLNLRLGAARTITLRGVPMPALEPDDVISIRYLDGRQEQLRITAVQLPLDVAGTMDIVATGHFRPQDLVPTRRRRRFHAAAGPVAWRELDEVGR